MSEEPKLELEQEVEPEPEPEPEVEPEPEPEVVDKLWWWEDVKETLHHSLQDECQDVWPEIDRVLTDVLHWHYKGECDLSECQTWKEVCECLWKHKEKGEFSDDYGILNVLD